MPDRDKIPEPVKRAVRQRCGFGCVICGMPIYVYDHIVEHSKVSEHNESNLTLLCDNHHRSKTARKISLEQIRSFNTNPINKNSSISRTGEQLFFSGDKIKMQLAGTWFFASLIPPVYRFDAIIVNERPLLSFHVDDGNLLLDIEGHDRDGNLVLLVSRSELRHTIGKWDIEYIGLNLRIREKPRDIILDLTLRSPDGVSIKCATFSFDDRVVYVKQDRIEDEWGNYLTGGRSLGLRYGVVMGRNSDNYGPTFASFY